jgi:isocitrate dehydrogenase
VIESTAITVAHGDGIGPEIMEATLRILDAAHARLAIETIEIGEAVYKRGVSAGIEPASWDSLRRSKVFLKAPITTPQGGGFKSLNVTVRKSLGLYANVRPCASYHPFVETKHPHMDVVIVRENEEDLYAGVEYRYTDQETYALKLISRPGTEKIVRYAFEFARHNNRERVSCFTKDNIMKLTDGLFHRVFEEVAEEYPDIEHSHMIVDIGAARLADTPDRFDVIVMPNLYGDILSDVAAQLIGSVGLCGSSNIGEHGAMFEAIHGSAPDIAGMNIANPSGLLLGAVMMLVHIGQGDVAELVHNAWLSTIEDGVHTPDVYHPGVSKQKVGTDEFTSAVMRRLGQTPKQLKPVRYRSHGMSHHISVVHMPRQSVRETVGVDLFVAWSNGTPEELAARGRTAETDKLQLQMITNRGVIVWPDGQPETFCTDLFRLRYLRKDESAPLTPRDIVTLLDRAVEHNIDFAKTEHLITFDGVPGFTLGQGQ